MAICYYEKERIFKLDTPQTSYVIAIVDEEGFLGHVYYGKKLSTHDIGYLLRAGEYPFVPSRNDRDRLSFYDSFSMEYPTYGIGDYRSCCLQARTPSGHRSCSLVYESHRILEGKPAPAGLPATFAQAADCSTLEITCRDAVLGLEVLLFYSAFNDVDAITRRVSIANRSQGDVFLESALSMCVDLDGIDYDMITLNGSWARERRIQRKAVGYGKQGVSSLRGEPGHQANPFMALLKKDATEDTGEVYGFNLVYSGNFLAEAEGCQFDTVRFVMGINPQGFEWKLEPGDCFCAPEAAMVYSDSGLGKMTRTFHDLYRNHLIRGKYRDAARPVLVNSWEAVYFDISSEKLLAMAKKAAELGIELFVLDDGWFGKRKDDNSSLGDWTVNQDKLQGGLAKLAEDINALGMKFGIWFEPEMVSRDSDLYRAHPDWAIQVPGRDAVLSRNQYVLDFSRKDVRDHVFQSMRSVLSGANISYLKWDMNRPLADLGSAALPADRQGELFHRYVLGVYDLMDRVTREFPDLLIENCSGGGARFDPGMLYYSPQIWCSDDTDAIERLSIQQGTAMVYPLSSMGSHVSDCPNHVVGRSTPFDTRGLVALAGTFGYELDVTRISDEDRKKVPAQIKLYREHNALVRTGDYYRIAGYADNHSYDCWQVVSKDKSESLVTFIQVLGRPNMKSRRIALKGLDAAASYRDTLSGDVFAGDALMYAGLPVAGLNGDFAGRLFHFLKV